MRVTNGMIRDNSLHSLYNNMDRLNTLYDQMNTLKKIQRPSDDPIIAGRSLKLRVNVLEAEQHKSNVKEATSWMEVSQTALGNITEMIKQIRTKCNQAANDTLGKEEREKVLTDIKQLTQQLQAEANTTYAGRYVFSGYKTDQSLVLSKDTQLKNDIQIAGNIQLNTDTKLSATTTVPAGTQLSTINELSSGDVIGAGEILKAGNVLPTGTVLANDIVDSDGNVLVPAGTLTGEVKLEKDASSAGDITLGADATIIKKETFTGPIGKDIVVEAGNILPKDTVLKAGTILSKGTINPQVLGQIDNQDIQYEVGVGININVNVLKMDTFINEMIQDLNTMQDALGDPPSFPPGITSEAEFFSGMLDTMDKRLSSVSEKSADLGSRQKRMEYTETRLVDYKTSFTELLSETEDVDLEEIYVEFNAQYSVYQSALQATSKVIMNTLADFLR